MYSSISFILPADGLTTDPMSSSVVKPSWISFAFILVCLVFLPLDVLANWTYGSNWDDYDFGWLASGVYEPGSEPYCTYCVNRLGHDPTYNESTKDLNTYGLFWNSTVKMYRCDGVQNVDEMWAYHEPSNSIVFGNVPTNHALCIDAASWNSEGVLKLRQCDTSIDTQRWTQKGNSLFSRLQFDGQPLLLVGGFPDKASNPTGQIVDYFLNLSSSAPSGSAGSGLSYTSNFTFLSAKNLINRATNAFTIEGLLGIKNSSRDIDQIVNGGFESSTIQAGSSIKWSDWDPKVPSYFALCGWVIYGVVDYVNSGYLHAVDGSYSVHLNSFTHTSYASTVSQAFKTGVGQEYLLSFSYNGFPPNLQPGDPTDSRNCGTTYTVARLQVRVASATSIDIATGASKDGSGLVLKENFTVDVTNFTADNFRMGISWQHQTLRFRPSTNATVISFSSLNFNDSCGPVIDNVLVTRPATHWQRTLVWVLITVGGLAFLVGLVYRLRCYEDNQDYSSLYKTEHTRVFSAKELSSATKKFSAVLGEGGFSIVYKADFPDGTMGAVKVEKQKGLPSSSKVFASTEIAVLLRVHHRNLVNLTGFCIDKGRHILVFEYLPNGSLHERLHQRILPSTLGLSMDSVEQPQLYGSTLSWQKRVKIVFDLTYGLEYLHHDADPPIVHRDVKSHNILLTATDSAKLADFGLSKAAPAEATTFQSIETMVRGSIGYLDPQYFLTGVFSAKSDVYSYGVVLLELISGQQALYNGASLASWAAPYLTNPSLYHELVDKKLDGKFDAAELEFLVELSKMCMLQDGKLRPSMRQVVSYLHSKQPAIAGGESPEQPVQESMDILSGTWHKMLKLDSVLTNSGSRKTHSPFDKD